MDTNSAEHWRQRMFEISVAMVRVMTERADEPPVLAWIQLQHETHQRLMPYDDTDPAALEAVYRQLSSAMSAFLLSHHGREALRDWHRTSQRVGSWLRADHRIAC